MQVEQQSGREYNSEMAQMLLSIFQILREGSATEIPSHGRHPDLTVMMKNGAFDGERAYSYFFSGSKWPATVRRKPLIELKPAVRRFSSVVDPATMEFLGEGCDGGPIEIEYVPYFIRELDLVLETIIDVNAKRSSSSQQHTFCRLIRNPSAGANSIVAHQEEETYASSCMLSKMGTLRSEDASNLRSVSHLMNFFNNCSFPCSFISPACIYAAKTSSELLEMTFAAGASDNSSSNTNSISGNPIVVPGADKLGVSGAAPSHNNAGDGHTVKKTIQRGEAANGEEASPGGSKIKAKPEATPSTVLVERKFNLHGKDAEANPNISRTAMGSQGAARSSLRSVRVTTNLRELEETKQHRMKRLQAWNAENLTKQASANGNATATTGRTAPTTTRERRESFSNSSNANATGGADLNSNRGYLRKGSELVRCAKYWQRGIESFVPVTPNIIWPHPLVKAQTVVPLMNFLHYIDSLSYYTGLTAKAKYQAVNIFVQFTNQLRDERFAARFNKMVTAANPAQSNSSVPQTPDLSSVGRLSRQSSRGGVAPSPALSQASNTSYKLPYGAADVCFPTGKDFLHYACFGCVWIAAKYYDTIVPGIRLLTKAMSDGEAEDHDRQLLIRQRIAATEITIAEALDFRFISNSFLDCVNQLLGIHGFLKQPAFLSDDSKLDQRRHSWAQHFRDECYYFADMLSLSQSFVVELCGGSFVKMHLAADALIRFVYVMSMRRTVGECFVHPGNEQEVSACLEKGQERKLRRYITGNLFFRNVEFEKTFCSKWHAAVELESAELDNTPLPKGLSLFERLCAVKDERERDRYCRDFNLRDVFGHSGCGQSDDELDTKKFKRSPQKSSMFHPNHQDQENCPNPNAAADSSDCCVQCVYIALIASLQHSMNRPTYNALGEKCPSLVGGRQLSMLQTWNSHASKLGTKNPEIRRFHYDLPDEASREAPSLWSKHCPNCEASCRKVGPTRREDCSGYESDDEESGGEYAGEEDCDYYDDSDEERENSPPPKCLMCNAIAELEGGIRPPQPSNKQKNSHGSIQISTALAELVKHAMLSDAEMNQIVSSVAQKLDDPRAHLKSYYTSQSSLAAPLHANAADVQASLLAVFGDGGTDIAAKRGAVAAGASSPAVSTPLASVSSSSLSSAASSQAFPSAANAGKIINNQVAVRKVTGMRDRSGCYYPAPNQRPQPQPQEEAHDEGVGASSTTLLAPITAQQRNRDNIAAEKKGSSQTHSSRPVNSGLNEWSSARVAAHED